MIRVGGYYDDGVCDFGQYGKEVIAHWDEFRGRREKNVSNKAGKKKQKDVFIQLFAMIGMIPFT